jgi:hypothetical protein
MSMDQYNFEAQRRYEDKLRNRRAQESEPSTIGAGFDFPFAGVLIQLLKIIAFIVIGFILAEVVKDMPINFAILIGAGMVAGAIRAKQ